MKKIYIILLITIILLLFCMPTITGIAEVGQSYDYNKYLNFEMGKNLFDKTNLNDYSTNNYNVIINEANLIIQKIGSYSSIGPQWYIGNVGANKDITLSWNFISTTLDTSPSLSFYGSVDGTSYSYIPSSSVSIKATGMKTINTDIYNYIQIRYGQTDPANLGSIVISNVQLELGTTATAYEPYEIKYSNNYISLGYEQGLLYTGFDTNFSLNDLYDSETFLGFDLFIDDANFIDFSYTVNIPIIYNDYKTFLDINLKYYEFANNVYKFRITYSTQYTMSKIYLPFTHYYDVDTPKLPYGKIYSFRFGILDYDTEDDNYLSMFLYSDVINLTLYSDRINNDTGTILKLINDQMGTNFNYDLTSNVHYSFDSSSYHFYYTQPTYLDDLNNVQSNYNYTHKITNLDDIVLIMTKWGDVEIAYANGYNDAIWTPEKKVKDAIYKDAYNKGYNAGMQSYDDNGSVFMPVLNTVVKVLSLEIFPNFKLGYIISIPLMLGLIFFVLKFIRG